MCADFKVLFAKGHPSVLPSHGSCVYFMMFMRVLVRVYLLSSIGRLSIVIFGEVRLKVMSEYGCFCFFPDMT